MKLLIVEDESSLRELLARALRKEQYVVETASTYAEASDKLAAYSYDCILLDIMLPDGNGLQLLERLRRADKREKRNHYLGSGFFGRQGPRAERRCGRLPA